MNFECKTFVSSAGDSEPAKIIQQGIIDYNKPWLGDYQTIEWVCIYMEDDDGNVIAGVSGEIVVDANFIYVHLVWVSEESRGKGLGKRLLEKLEEHLRAKNCHTIQLDTFEFQALDFYKKLGYECIGTIPKFIKGQDKHFMRKML